MKELYHEMVILFQGTQTQIPPREYVDWARCKATGNGVACGNRGACLPQGIHNLSLLSSQSAALVLTTGPDCLPAPAALHRHCQHPGPLHSHLGCHRSLLLGLPASNLCPPAPPPPEPDAILSLSTQSYRDPAPQTRGTHSPPPGTIIEWKEQGLNRRFWVQISALLSASRVTSDTLLNLLGPQFSLRGAP